MAEKPKNKKKGFNLYWIYAILAVVLIAFNLIPGRGGVVEIQESDFETLVMKGYVQKIVIIKNHELAEVYLDQDKIEDVKALDEKYEKLKAKTGAAKSNPDLEFSTPEMRTFEENVKALNEDVKLIDPEFQFSVERDTRKDWAGDLLGWLLFPVLLIVFWIVIMRRMSGGGGGGGGGGNIFSIGKSKAKVFEKGKGTDRKSVV